MMNRPTVDDLLDRLRNRAHYESIVGREDLAVLLGESAMVITQYQKDRATLQASMDEILALLRIVAADE